MTLMPTFEIGYDVVDTLNRDLSARPAPHYYVNGIEVPKAVYYAKWLSSQHDLNQVDLTNRRPLSFRRL